MPFSAGVPVFAGLNEGSRDANLRAYEMPPLIPRRIPADWEDRGIEVYLRFSSAVAIQRIPIEVFNAPQRSTKQPLPLVWQVRQELAHKKRLFILRQLARDNTLAETAVGE